MGEPPEIERPYPYELRLPIAPYRFLWSSDAAIDCRTRRTPLFNEEHYSHADGTVVIIRNYLADGSFHLMSDRGDIQLIDNANNYRSPDPISIVRLP